MEETKTNTKEPIPKNKTDQDADKHAEVAAFSYVPFMGILTLIMRKDSRFIQFHAQQGVILSLLFLFLWWMGDVISLFRYLAIFPTVGIILGFLQAFHKQWYQIPVIYELTAQGFAPQKAWKYIRFSGKFFYNAIIGLLPKKMQTDIKDFHKENTVSDSHNLEKRVFEIEKFLLQERFFSPHKKGETLSSEAEKFIETIKTKLIKTDNKTQEKKMIHSFDFQGSFGIVMIGNIRTDKCSLLWSFKKKSDIQNEKIFTNPDFQMGAFKGKEIFFPPL